MKELCPDQGAPVPPDELFEEWEAEVADVLQGRKDLEYGWPADDLEQDLIDRARSALAQPVPAAEGEVAA